MDIVKIIFNSFRSSKGVSYNSNGEVMKCLFCDVCDKKEPGTIIYETDDLVVFRTLKPYTTSHLLVSPRKHIQSVLHMKGEDDCKLIDGLVEAGKEALNILEPNLGNTGLFVFHVPPFNSIDHLHLHAIGNPETLTFLGGQKYSPGRLYCYGIDQAKEAIMKADAAASTDGEKSKL
jgi:diadenosine tetraphosphate (Ap4A) HIT family hydrolase